MLCKLILRNVHRSARDYGIYLVTLILSVGMFYGFLSLSSSHYQAALPRSIHLELLERGMQVAIPVLGLLLLFLLSYVNAHLLRAKQKSFAVQTILGMERRTVALLFFGETLLLGSLAILAGIALGAFLSQLASFAVFRAFGESYRLQPGLFPDTLAQTLLFFGGIFLVVGLRNLVLVRRLPVLSMLQADRKTESFPLRTQMRGWIPAVLLVSTAAGGLILSLLSRLSFPLPWLLALLLVLGAALWNLVTGIWFLRACRSGGGERPLFLLSLGALLAGGGLLALYPLMKSLVRQGALQAYLTMPPLLALLLVVFALVGLFSTLSWSLSRSLRPPKPRYYRNLFLLGQLKSRLGSGAKTMGVITVVLTAALVCFTLLPLLAVRIQGYQQVLSVYEVQVGTIYTAQEDALPTGPLDDQFLTDTLNQGGYPVTGTASGALYLLRREDLKRRDRDLPLLAVSLSSYNQLRALSGLPPLSLATDQYGVAWSNTTPASTIDGFQQTAPVLTAGGSRLHKAPALDCQDSVGISLFTSQTEAVYILPDAACQGLTMATTFYAANTAQPLSYSFAQSFDQIAAAHQQSLGRFAPENLYVRLHTLQANEGVSNLLLLSLVGTYAGGILMISCLTLLAVQQLTDARQQRRRFQTAIHLGMAAEDRDQVIRRQMLFWFGLPVAAAVLCSLGVLVFFLGINYEDFTAYLPLSRMFLLSALAYGSFLLLLLCYFTATYHLFRRAMASP